MLGLGQVFLGPLARRTCKDAFDVAAIDACYANFEGCKTLPGALGQKYRNLTPAEAKALPVCKLTFVATPAALALRETTPAPPAPVSTAGTWTAGRLAVAGLIVAAVGGGGYLVYRNLRKKE